MAFTVSVAMLKGGVGKTTTAVAIAEAAAQVAAVTLVDADPMAGAYLWSQLAAASGRPLRSAVVPVATPDLAVRVPAAGRGAGIVVIDSPPPGNLRVARSAIAVADFVLLPAPPETAALARAERTADIAREEGKPFAAVLTMTRAGLPGERAQALELLESWGIPLLAAELPLTVSVQRCYGQPVSGLLARYGADVMTEVLRRNRGETG